MNYPKGSEWRKWDLQVQTVLDDNYLSLGEYADTLKDADATRWQQYVAKVGGEENAILFDSRGYFNDASKDKKTRCVDYTRNLFAFLETYTPELACIGITDHNYFDDHLLDTLIDYSRRAHCRVIPGVELNCGGVHLLLYFRDKLYGKASFSAGIQAFLTKFDIDTPKKNGVLTITSCDIKEIIREVRANDGIVIFPHCRSANGLFSLHDKTVLAEAFNLQKVNLLQFQNREGFADAAGYINSNPALTSKYCFHISSDSRSLKDIGRPDKDGNFLWIKANPTFDGLKQIVFEPEQRVVVAPQRPEQKKPYFLIDKVRFLDNTTGPRFGSDAIGINQNLTAIVGGKSTGKSLLLYYAAKTINKTEVEDRIAPTGLEVSYTLEESPDFNFEVLWADGQSTLLRPPPGTPAEESKERKILYVPQRYLNTLSEKRIESREALNDFILNVILQDVAIRERYEETLEQNGLVLQSIPTKIAELFAEADEIKKTEEELKQAGDEKGIGAYIQTLQAEVDAIKAQSGLSDDEIKHYEALTLREQEISGRISNLDSDRKTLRTLQGQLTTKLDDARLVANEYEGYINDADVKLTLTAELKVLDSFGPATTKAMANVLASISHIEEKLKVDLAAIKAKLAPLLTKVQAQSSLKEKSESIQKEQQKLKEIGIKKNAVRTKEASFKKRVDSLIEAYTQVAAKYEALRNDFKTFESKFGDISLAVHVAFDDETFNEVVVDEHLNKKNLKKCLPETDWTEDSKYKYDQQRHLANIATILRGLIAGTVATVKNRSTKDAVAKLLEDHFFLDFKIFYRNDSLEKMSPGKKGLVLLRLLINLSNEEWPILLDQPEDDLDNRSVYEDLVRFLKEKKTQRQIIVVTHNPNLVVGADAEEVIVANQSGQEVGRENRKFQFEYVSDALEDAFELDESKERAILFRKGVRQHVCEILEGGQEAFQKREQKYNFPLH